MPTLGAIASRDIGFFFAGVIVGCAKSGSLEITRGTEETTCDDSGNWKESKAGIMEWNMSIEGVVKYDNQVNFEEFFDALVLGDPVEMKFGTEVTGDIVFSGNAIITSLSKNKNEGRAVASYSLSVEGTGPLNKSIAT